MGDLTSPRLRMLEHSLAKKRAKFDAQLSAHFASVREANGQPLNDKRCGGATIAKWDRQNDALRKLDESIKTTEAAIEREVSTLANVACVALPEPIAKRIGAGELSQWRKHPNTFFVVGVDKARIVLLDDGRVAHRYANHVTDPDQRKLLAQTFNAILREVEAGTPQGAGGGE